MGLAIEGKPRRDGTAGLIKAVTEFHTEDPRSMVAAGFFSKETLNLSSRQLAWT